MPASKEEMVRELSQNGIVVPKGMSVTELSTLLRRLKESKSQDATSGKGQYKLKKDFMSCLTGIRKEGLMKLVIDLGGLPQRRWTKGDALLWIRESVPQISKEPVGFGKHQKLSMEQVALECQDYVKWTLQECTAESCEKMRRFTAYCRVIFQGLLKNDTDSEGEDSSQSQTAKKEKPPVKEEKTEERPRSKLTAKEVPIPDSDPESEQSDDPKKKKKVSARPAVRPEHFVMESDSSATSWMELSEKRTGRPSKK
jgi:hypothetical protein